MRWFALPITRSPAQKLACKDLGRDDLNRAITPKATYTPASKRAGSRSHHNAFAGAGVCV
ncbi:ATP-dependent nuclease subunit B [Lacticaseibacillus zeae]|uniref:ATP-dependent nuclease subunit B n=1 Tax=Lacticaseibacillus zeae TaxID=57037 RepID=A0A5R8M2Z0_LACZE|nr:ATP-dependent nuclease subunit B [Lacticaseibacillus zeae]